MQTASTAPLRMLTSEQQSTSFSVSGLLSGRKTGKLRFGQNGRWMAASVLALNFPEVFGAGLCHCPDLYTWAYLSLFYIFKIYAPTNTLGQGQELRVLFLVESGGPVHNDSNR